MLFRSQRSSDNSMSGSAKAENKRLRNKARRERQKANKLKKELNFQTQVSSTNEGKKRYSKRFKPPGTRMLGDGEDAQVVAAKEFVSNLVCPRQPFLIPRVVPHEAVPNYFTTRLNIDEVPSSRFGALMFQPSLIAPCAQMVLSSPGMGYTNGNFNSYHHLSWNYADQWIDYDNNLYSGKSAIAPYTIAAGLHYRENAEFVDSGGKAFRGPCTVGANSFYMVVRNNSATALTITAQLQRIGEDGTRGAAVTSTGVDIAHGGTGSVLLPNFNSDVDDFAISFKYTNTVGGGVPNTASLDICFQGSLVLGQHWTWERKSFFANAKDQSDVMHNFYAAHATSTTGFAVTLSNLAAEIQAGGGIVGVYCPGGSRDNIPTNPQDLYDWAASRNTRHKLHNQHLKTGLFWTYRPEKIQDLMFRPHADVENQFLFGDKNLPFILVAYFWPNELQVPSLSAEININIEYLTNSIVNQKWLPAGDTAGLMQLWTTLSAHDPCFTENPSHLDYVKKFTNAVADKTVRNPAFRNAALQLGKQLGTLALAAVV